MSGARRHSWGEPERFVNKTERTCCRCDVVKVTRHEPFERSWVEFWRDGDRLQCQGTPPCEGGRE
jgi:hypothetical protein